MRATLYASLTVCLWLVFRAAAIDGMNPDSNFLIKVPNPPGPAPLASAASLSIVNAQNTYQSCGSVTTTYRSSTTTILFSRAL